MANTVTPPNLEEDLNTPAAATPKEAPQTQAAHSNTQPETLNEIPELLEDEDAGRENFFLSQLATLQAEVDEHKNNAIRAVAEMENIRRRAQEDILKASKFAIESFAEQLLSVKDSLEMALANPNDDLKNLRHGVELTLKQLSHAFDRAKVVEVASEGQPFDPNIHQAVSAVESSSPANTVVQVYQKGYRLNDRVLRPALVVVAKG